MADKKISALTGATTPLAGTEVLPIVQGGSTVKVSVDNLTAGKAVNASSLQLGDIGAADATYQGRLKLEDGPTSLQQIGGVEFVTSSYAAGYGWKISSIDSSGVQLAFGTRQNSANWTETIRLTSDNNLKISNAGKGIDFSANSNAPGMTSELLTWYEEGTWTPTDASGAGLTFTVSYAKYTRIGRAVFINAYFEYPATANGSNTSLSGLPFTVASSNYPPFVVNSNSGTALSAFADATATTFKFVATTNYSTNIVNSTLSGNGVIISGCYFTS